MAGHLGAERVTTQGLEIVRVDADRGLIWVKGSIPGAAGGWVEVRDAVKGVKADDLPYPAKLREAAKPVEESSPADAADAGAGEAQSEGASE
jgi:large subunit ribosomal protein L3